MRTSASRLGAGCARSSGPPVPIRFWIEQLPEVRGVEPAKLFNNALGSWQAVVVTPIGKADSEAEANHYPNVPGDDRRRAAWPAYLQDLASPYSLRLCGILGPTHIRGCE